MTSVVKKVVVNAPISQVFGFWSNFQNFPRFMQNVEEIESIGPDETRWTIKGPLGAPIYWDAKMTYSEENKKIAWVTTSGEIETHGAVLFEALSDDTTEVTVGLEYNAASGSLGEGIAKLLHDPEHMLEEDLNRFKMVVESSEVLHAV